MVFRRTVLAVFLGGLFAAGCADEPSAPVVEEPVVVGRVSLGVDSVTVKVGTTVTITAAVFDTKGRQLDRLPDGGTISWSTTDVRIATVNDGIVTGVGPGRAIITARAGGQLGATRVGVELPSQN